MKQIKQIHQSLELAADRLQKTIDDLKEVGSGHYDYTEEEKSFKLGELSCILSIGLEDLKLDLDELGREISKQEVTPEAPTKGHLVEKFIKAAEDRLKEQHKEERRKREQIDKWKDLINKPVEYLYDGGPYQEPTTGTPPTSPPFYTTGVDKQELNITGGQKGTCSNAPNSTNWTYIKYPEPPKEFTTGYSEVEQKVGKDFYRVVDRTWHNDNGINYEVVTKHNNGNGYKTEVYIYAKNKSLATAEECTNTIRPTIKKVCNKLKLNPIDLKRFSSTVYVSDESFNNIHKDLMKEFRDSPFFLKTPENGGKGLTKIQNTSSKKFITLNHQLGQIRIEAVI